MGYQMSYTIKEVNFDTGETVERDMTADEIAQKLNDDAARELLKEAQKIKAVQRQALLDKLGITEEEAKLLLS